MGSGQANLLISKDYHPNNRHFQALYDLFLPLNDQQTEKKAPEFDSSFAFKKMNIGLNKTPSSGQSSVILIS